MGCEKDWSLLALKKQPECGQPPETGKSKTKKNEILFWSLQKRRQPCQHFEMHFKTSDPQNCKLIHLCCFQLPSLWNLLQQPYETINGQPCFLSAPELVGGKQQTWTQVSADTQATIQRSGSGEEVGQKRATEGGAAVWFHIWLGPMG